MYRLYSELADLYDFIFDDKDYQGQCEFIASKLDHIGKRMPRALELGCGTGGHLLCLAGLGFEVTGIDNSARMLDVAAKKCKSARLIHADMVNLQELGLEGKFDIVLSLGTTIAYLSGYDAFEKVAYSAWELLEKDGIFAFDLWKTKPCDSGSLVRTHSSPVAGRNIVRAIEWKPRGDHLVSYDCFIIPTPKGEKAVFDIHRLALFEIERLEGILGRVGFRVRMHQGFQEKAFASGKAVFMCTKEGLH